MKHRIKTVKFKYGRNANKMLVRNLLKSFIGSGKMTTTEKKIKVVKKEIEKLIQLAKKNTEASRVSLRKRLADRKVEEILFKNIVPAFKEKVSGFTTLTHFTQRDSDGASIARLQWSVAIVLDKPVKKAKKKTKEEVQTDTKNKKKEVKTKKVSKKTKKV